MAKSERQRQQQADWETANRAERVSRRREQRLRKKLEGQARAKPHASPVPVARAKPVGSVRGLPGTRKVTAIAPSQLQGEILRARAGERNQIEPALLENKELVPFGNGAAIIDLCTGKRATKAAILSGQLCLVQNGERSFTIRLANDGRIEARCSKCRQLCFQTRSQVAEWAREHGCVN